MKVLQKRRSRLISVFTHFNVKRCRFDMLRLFYCFSYPRVHNFIPDVLEPVHNEKPHYECFAECANTSNTCSTSTASSSASDSAQDGAPSSLWYMDNCNMGAFSLPRYYKEKKTYFDESYSSTDSGIDMNSRHECGARSPAVEYTMTSYACHRAHDISL